MYHFDDIAYSDTKLRAEAASENIIRDFSLDHIDSSSVCIPDRIKAILLSSLGEAAPEKARLNILINEYNDYVDRIRSIPGFIDFFVANRFCVSKQNVIDHWSEEIAAIVFGKPVFVFDSPLSIIDDWIFDKSVIKQYTVTIDGNVIHLPIGDTWDHYPKELDGKEMIWNWVDNGHDFCFFVWNLIENLYHNAEDGPAYSFDFYDQSRLDISEPQLVKIIHKLEELKYMQSFTVFPADEDPRWRYYGKADGSIDIALINRSFMSNKLLMEQIGILLNSSDETVQSKPYFLTDNNGKQYLSSEAGVFGGHCKLKIYGKLDCTSAARHIAKGKYVQHRVFFRDEPTAIAAGYRPCGKCMPEAYRKWKEDSK